MKAEIRTNGQLVVIAENNTEEYALHIWHTTNINPCTGVFIIEVPWKAFGITRQTKKINIVYKWWVRMQFRFKLWFVRKCRIDKNIVKTTIYDYGKYRPKAF